MLRRVSSPCWARLVVTGTPTSASLGHDRSFCQGFRENELIAPQVAAFRAHLLEQKAAVAEEVENLLRLGDLEGVTAYPIDQIPPRRHASRASCLTPALERPQKQQIL